MVDHRNSKSFELGLMYDLSVHQRMELSKPWISIGFENQRAPPARVRFIAKELFPRCQDIHVVVDAGMQAGRPADR